MKIYKKISIPAKQQNLSINNSAKWYTWSNETSKFLKLFHEVRDSGADVKHICLINNKSYDYTMSLDLLTIRDKEARRGLLEMANSLYMMRVPNHIMLFSDLFNEDFNAKDLHYLFSYLRGALVKITKDPMCALYSPLQSDKSEKKDFPLHADLYVPKLLFNVFNDVPNNSSGASTFLPVIKLQKILSEIKLISIRNKERILSHLTNMDKKDHYAKFFNLLHGSEHPWKNELEKRMESQQESIKLNSGQGYLIHDRRWLHGRTATKGKVTKNRLYRITFDTKATINKHNIIS